MADFSRDPREHWLKPRFSKNEVANSGSRLLTREILYTGITRTKKMVFLFGSDKAVEKSCKSVVSRVTGFIDPEN